MLTYQCSFCFYFCDLNLEVIEIFQANNYCLPEWKKRLYHLPMEISGNFPRNFWSNGKRPVAPFSWKFHSLHFSPGARFSKAPESFRARKAFLEHLYLKTEKWIGLELLV